MMNNPHTYPATTTALSVEQRVALTGQRGLAPVTLDALRRLLDAARTLPGDSPVTVHVPEGSFDRFDLAVNHVAPVVPVAPVPT